MSTYPGTSTAPGNSRCFAPEGMGCDTREAMERIRPSSTSTIGDSTRAVEVSNSAAVIALITIHLLANAIAENSSAFWTCTFKIRLNFFQGLSLCFRQE